MPSEASERVVIIGAGHAGGEVAQRLRQVGFRGAITLVGAERSPPYQRPPLSKAYLKGEISFERLLLRPADVYAAEDIALLTGVECARVDRVKRAVRLADGRSLPYDKLVLATGARPRLLQLPGADLPGVQCFRTLVDADALRPRLTEGAKLVVIGAGYIGLEAAAIARQFGVDVTVVETAQRPLARVTSPEVAGFFLQEHMRRGVRFVLGAAPTAIEGRGRVERVLLEDGAMLPADIVIAGIGVTPETELASQCGLDVGNGVITDAEGRTSDPSIFAIGDCAARPTSFYQDRLVRLESVHNATEGARVVAAVIAATPRAKLEAPWFWSDQYGLKLQIAGLFHGYDHVAFRGAMAECSFAAFYYQGEKLIAVDAVCRPAEYVGAKTLIQTARTIAPEVIVDQSRSMKDLVASAR